MLQKKWDEILLQIFISLHVTVHFTLLSPDVLFDFESTHFQKKMFETSLKKPQKTKITN